MKMNRSKMNAYYTYILSNQSRTLYVGVTNDLERRVRQHRSKGIPGFTAKYNVTELVFYESTNDVKVAIAREKQIKGWTRAKKIALIETINPRWEDLSVSWRGIDASLHDAGRGNSPLD
jgi:putative endonuclease